MNNMFGLEMDQLAKIKVIGVGGGGCNAVNRMIESGLKGVEFIVANTDLQVLNNSLAPIKLQIGRELTDGLGAGANPEIGREAALESKGEIEASLTSIPSIFFKSSSICLRIIPFKQPSETGGVTTTLPVFINKLLCKASTTFFSSFKTKQLS